MEYHFGNTHLLYILESNPHPFYSFRELKNQMQIRITCGLHLRSRAGLWKNDRAAVHAVITIQYNNLLFIIYNILYNIYNLLFIRIPVNTHNEIVICHPALSSLSSPSSSHRCGLEPQANFFFI